MKSIVTFVLLSLTTALSALPQEVILGISNSPNSGKSVVLSYKLFDYSFVNISALAQYSHDYYVKNFISLKAGDEIRNTKENNYTDQSFGLGLSAKFLAKQYIPGFYINSNIFLNSHKISFHSEETVRPNFVVLRFSEEKRGWDGYFNLETGYQINISNFIVQAGWLYGNGIYLADYLNEIPSETNSLKLGIGYTF
ncbi:MAG: hypothetical protein J0L62_08355 [Bacteroidetes bacterium]|nr:hypothetical protein [Bacteroidota bacterium]